MATRKHSLIVDPNVDPANLPLANSWQTLHVIGSVHPVRKWYEWTNHRAALDRCRSTD